MKELEEYDAGLLILEYICIIATIIFAFAKNILTAKFFRCLVYPVFGLYMISAYYNFFVPLTRYYYPMLIAKGVIMVSILFIVCHLGYLLVTKGPHKFFRDARILPYIYFIWTSLTSIFIGVWIIWDIPDNDELPRDVQRL